MRLIRGIVLIVVVIFIGTVACAGVMGAISGAAAPTYSSNVDEVWASETGAAAVNNSPAKSKSNLTVSQSEAVESAQNYVDVGQFSKVKLIRQLSSGVAEDFTKSEATYAATHIDVDWNQEALQAAELYMEIGSYSRTTLIKKLTSTYGEEFTKAQALYAVDKVGL